MRATLRADPPPGRRCRGEERSKAARVARKGSAIAYAITIAFALLSVLMLLLRAMR
jgi:hypothetical protein